MFSYTHCTHCTHILLTVIPPEIVKRGPVFVERYKQALRHGKEKIPRCGLLLLGEARKGKTSLYKLIVGGKFDPNQESTRGIDNNEVDTVDSRAVTMNWSETSEEDQQRERTKFHAIAIVDELPPDDEKKQAASLKFQEKSLNDLLQRIEDIDTKINKEKKPPITKTPNLRKERGPNDLDSFLLSEPRPSNYHSDRQLESPPVKDHPLPPPILSQSVANFKLILPEKTVPIPKPPSKPQVPKVSPVIKADLRPLHVPTKTAQPEQMKRSNSGSSRLDAETVNRTLKDRKHLTKNRKEPKLVLNVLDFAGQKNYRPMHHCFIRRRSMYIVVFNLQDLCECIQQADSSQSPPNPDSCQSPQSPVEEIRYWLHSIHAHIYPPESNEKKRRKDECQRRVLLVGTHRNPGTGKEEITENIQKKIDNLLQEELESDDRCVNHLCRVDGRCFIAVENSVPDQTKSGARKVQKKLHSITERLKFLDEVYPLSWLRFEGKLKEIKKDIKREIEQKKEGIERCCRENRMIEIAERKGVPNPTDALEFFHDIGEIILLSTFITCTCIFWSSHLK